MIKTRQRHSAWDTRTLTVSARAIQHAQFRVEVVSGPDTGMMVSSGSEEVTIGTAPGCTLILTDASVSRHHCSIRTTERGYHLTDLGSRNGTRVGGVRVERGYLHPGVKIDVGESTLQFDVDGTEVSESLAESSSFGDVEGESSAMRRIFAILERAAPTEASILLEGESGTGKTVLAREVHQHSRRKDASFHVVDCAAITPSLIESELFGHEKGAFTGADATHVGLLEAASGGTVFLDEIGELPVELQPKLLRALESRQVSRIGGVETIPLDFRVIAATHRDLRKEVNQGTFRPDLYYRLSTLRVQIPPLRERTEDIPLIAARLFRQQCPDDPELPPELLREIMRHSWPGNVRELRNAVELYAVTGEIPPLRRQPTHDLSKTFRESKRRAVDEWERSYLRNLMRAYNGNLSRASRAVKMDRNHLRTLLERHGLHS